MSLEIADMLIKYELLISELYSCCANEFPQLSDFWNRLSKEEIKHAEAIKEILEQVDGRNIVYNPKRFNSRPLEISMQHVSDIIGRLKIGDIDLLGILSLALDIEQSVIESQYYEIFSGRDREFNVRLKQVRNESRQHAAIIRDMKQKAVAGEIPD